MKVKILASNLEESKGFDIQVIDDEATVQDYLDATNKYILEGELDRLRRKVSECEGCSTCCRERIPLTYIDIKNIMKAPYVKELLGEKDPSLLDTLDKCCQIIVDGRSVDIILDRNHRGTCIFLNTKEGLCKIYQHRPLVCQSYICCSQSERAKELRNKIVNSGEDELVRQWILKSIETNQPLMYHEGYNPNIRLEDWPETPLNKDSYKDVPLKDLL